MMASVEGEPIGHGSPHDERRGARAGVLAGLVVLAIVLAALGLAYATGPTDQAGFAAAAGSGASGAAGAAGSGGAGAGAGGRSGSASSTANAGGTGHAGARHHAAVAPPLSALHGTPVTVAVNTTSPGRAVPRDFLGLSFEVGELPLLARYAEQGNMPGFLRSLAGGVMRLGGVSADTTAAWTGGGAGGSAAGEAAASAPTARPAWASTGVTGADLRGIAKLTVPSGWSVLLTVNLGHPDDASAAAEARAAHAILGPRLAGIEIGNEPDAYVNKGLRTQPWDFARYRREIAAYQPALLTAAPGTPVVGPDASSGAAPLAWVRAYAAAEHPSLLTDHFYPSSRCGYTPSLSDLLSPALRSQQQAMLASQAAIAHDAHTPLRVDETNNISCGGQPGVSNTFASALWAVGYIAQAMSAGVAGLNFHDLIAAPQGYGALVAPNAGALADGDLHAAPEWYALLLAHRLVGDRPVGAGVAGGRAADVAASALLSRDGRLHIVLVDTSPSGSDPDLVHLAVPHRYTSGAILRLTAPSEASTGDVTLGRHAVAADGRWAPADPLPRVSGGAGTLALSLPADSAALVTLYARPHAPSDHHPRTAGAQTTRSAR